MSAAVRADPDGEKAKALTESYSEALRRSSTAMAATPRRSRVSWDPSGTSLRHLDMCDELPAAHDGLQAGLGPPYS